MNRLFYFIIIIIFHPFSLLAQQPNKPFGVIDDSYTVNPAGVYVVAK